MKFSKVLKVLGAVAAVAALTPYEVEKDEETGVTTMKALLWRARHIPATEETGRDVDVAFGLNIPGREGEAELFADDEPEAAVLDEPELQVTVDESQDDAADEAAEAAEPDEGDEADSEF